MRCIDQHPGWSGRWTGLPGGTGREETRRLPIRFDQPGCFALLACLLVVCAASAGCRRYPDASPKTYELAQALYTVCNQKAEARLGTVEQLVDEAEQAGEVPEREAGWLRDVIATARDGEWEDAAAEARRIMADQVEY